VATNYRSLLRKRFTGLHLFGCLKGSETLKESHSTVETRGGKKLVSGTAEDPLGGKRMSSQYFGMSFKGGETFMAGEATGVTPSTGRWAWNGGVFRGSQKPSERSTLCRTTVVPMCFRAGLSGLGITVSRGCGNCGIGFLILLAPRVL